MSKESQRLRREVRAELELMSASQSASNTRIEQLSESIERHADQIAEQGDRIAEQGERIAEQGKEIARQGQEIARQGHEIARQGHEIQASMKQTAALGREVADLGGQLVGRLKQFDQKFGKFLHAVEKESAQRFEALEARVARLEAKSDPAA